MNVLQVNLHELIQVVVRCWWISR